MVLTEGLLIPVPDDLPTGVAALTEPMAVALHSLSRVDTDAGGVPLVLGCGPIGLAVILAILKARGIDPIVAARPRPSGASSRRRWEPASSSTR